MSRPFVIPFFIAHQGCPHQCSFCNQHAITGSAGPELEADEILHTVREHLARPRRKERRQVQIAFYGGSFTGLPEKRQQELLAAVQPLLVSGAVNEIRISTRPDCINPAIVEFLRAHGVGIVELGIQSMDDDVLAASGRGHTVADSEKAISCLKKGGIKVGVQMMVGLPRDRISLVVRGAQRLAALEPDLARIYPAVVLRGSRLEDEFIAGRYNPLSLAKAVAVSGRMKEIFDRAGIRVVRVGLQDVVGLQQEIVAGPFHPAFGEMVLSRNLYRKVGKLLTSALAKSGRRLSIAAADQSVFRGQGNRNTKRLLAKGLLDGVEVVFDPELPRNSVVVEGTGY